MQPTYVIIGGLGTMDSLYCDQEVAITKVGMLSLVDGAELVYLSHTVVHLNGVREGTKGLITFLTH